MTCTVASNWGVRSMNVRSTRLKAAIVSTGLLMAVRRLSARHRCRRPQD
jgi:hypothetical protein